jgi:imidazolonepropionase-like amidohydrolase
MTERRLELVVERRSAGHAIVADVLVDGRGGEPLDRPAISLSRGRIVSVEERTTRWRPPDEFEILDVEGCSVLPGLIDAHVHLAFSGHTEPEISSFVASADEADVLSAMRCNGEEALRAGVTTLRDCGAPGRTAITMRDTGGGRAAAMPRLLVSGTPITTTEGHCHWMGLVADTADELRAAVGALIDAGVDFVKVMATGGMMTPGSNPYAAQYSQGELEVVVTEAHARGRRVAAHVLCADGLRNAVGARVDTVEHCWTITGARQDYDAALAVPMARAGVFGSVTAHGALRSLLRVGDLDELRRRLDAHRRFREAGVRMVVHSDAGTPGTAFGDFALSVEVFMHGLGTTVSEAITAATSIPAEALGIDSEVGTIEAGKRADLLIVEGDLPADVQALRRVRHVIVDGTPLDEVHRSS